MRLAILFQALLPLRRTALWLCCVSLFSTVILIEPEAPALPWLSWPSTQRPSQEAAFVVTIVDSGSDIVLEWDERKSQANLSKHGLAFQDAETVFAGHCLTFEDNRFDYEEQRFITLGELDGRVVVVAHTDREENIRIISMRKANSRERKAYEERLAPS